MSSTESRKTNGKSAELNYVPSPQTAPVLTVFQTHTPEPERRPQISPEELYGYYDRASGSVKADATMALAARESHTGAKAFREAYGDIDELTRENHVSIGLTHIYGLARFVGSISNSYDDVFAILMAAVVAHRTSVYSLPQIRSLENVLERLARSPNPSPSEVNAIQKLMAAASFDLNWPLAGVDLEEIEE